MCTPSTSPLVAICMAVYRPKPDLFKRQIDSIREQSHRNWILVISDETEATHPDASALLDRDILDKTIIHRSDKRLGFSLNFERAMLACPDDASYIAFCDQDDYWYPNKLETLLANIGTSGAIFSDFRAIDTQGRTISNTQWKNRDVCYKNAADLMLFNAVAGASLMVRRPILEMSLPFPRFKNMLYDHWIALIAVATAGLTHCNIPLYDYVQHGDNAIGFNFILDRRKHKKKIEKLLKELLTKKQFIHNPNITSAFEAVSNLYWYTSTTSSALITRMNELEKYSVINEKQKTAVRMVHNLCFGSPFEPASFRKNIDNMGLSDSSNALAKGILFYRKFLHYKEKNKSGWQRV